MSAPNVNVVVISGNLTKDPELHHTKSGIAVCRLRVAVNSRRKVGEEWVDKPNFFNVTVFGGLGENCAKYLTKGSGVTVEGRLNWEEWDAKDGSGKRQAVDIIANTAQFGPKLQQSGGAQGGSEKTAENTGQREVGAGAEAPVEAEATPGQQWEDDIPF